MKQIELTPVQTLLRESISARINQTAEALCEADISGNKEPMKQQPMELFTAIAAQIASEHDSEDEISHMVNTGALFTAQMMRMQHLARELQKESEELRESLFNYQCEAPSPEAPIIEPDFENKPVTIEEEKHEDEFEAGDLPNES